MKIMNDGGSSSSNKKAEIVYSFVNEPLQPNNGFDKEIIVNKNIYELTSIETVGINNSRMIGEFQIDYNLYSGNLSPFLAIPIYFFYKENQLIGTKAYYSFADNSGNFSFLVPVSKISENSFVIDMHVHNNASVTRYFTGAVAIQ